MKNLNENIGLIERFLVITEKYKISTIFKSVFVMIVFAIAIFVIANPTYFFDQYEKVK